MKLEFLPEAEKELREAARYYENEAPGVGLAFLAELHKAASDILENPRSTAEIRSSIRKKLLHRFPFNILYSIENDIILIIAVAHQKRRPTYWRSRLKSKRR